MRSDQGGPGPGAYTDEPDPYANPHPEGPLPDPYGVNRAAPSAADPYGVGAGRATRPAAGGPEPEADARDGAGAEELACGWGALSVVERGRVRLPRGGGERAAPRRWVWAGAGGTEWERELWVAAAWGGARGEREGAAEGGESAAAAEAGDAGGGARVRVERRGEPTGERGGEYGVYGPRQWRGRRSGRKGAGDTAVTAAWSGEQPWGHRRGRAPGDGACDVCGDGIHGGEGGGQRLCYHVRWGAANRPRPPIARSHRRGRAGPRTHADQ
ncbi:hypothetical protein B0H14DRAFT_696952 [Mycena olivaceomarginata]|nr:hypothetical protein B0H14DRAFT_696952 [Mycena olivaceomarginata]